MTFPRSRPLINFSTVEYSFHLPFKATDSINFFQILPFIFTYKQYFSDWQVSFARIWLLSFTISLVSGLDLIILNTRGSVPTKTSASLTPTTDQHSTTGSFNLQHICIRSKRLTSPLDKARAYCDSSPQRLLHLPLIISQHPLQSITFSTTHISAFLYPLFLRQIHRSSRHGLRQLTAPSCT